MKFNGVDRWDEAEQCHYIGENSVAQMLREEKVLCVCGSPEKPAQVLRDLLRLQKPYSLNEMDKLIPDRRVLELLLHWMTELDLTTHGGSVWGSFLTDKGKRVLDALNACDDLDALNK